VLLIKVVENRKCDLVRERRIGRIIVLLKKGSVL
jgi:hypothetical protein